MSKKKAVVTGNNRGTIILISGLLVASAGVRVASSAGEELPLNQALTLPTSMQSSEQVMPEQNNINREQMASLFSALQERETAISQREATISVREKALSVARKEIERRLVALEQAENQLRGTLAQADSATENDITRLIAVYENMKPKDAAALFDTMEPEFAAGFLGRMRPDAAANIMAGLSPQVAYSISVILAGRNANAPKS